MIDLKRADEAVYTARGRLFRFLHALYTEYKSVILAGLAVGLAAHMFMITNKLVNFDEITFLYSKGITWRSGRWGLVIVTPLFPNCSMPWLYGIICIAFLTAAACITVKIFDIRSTSCRVLTAGLLISFPAWTGVFSFMFTSAPYAMALLMSTLAVELFESGKRGKMIISCLLVCFSAGIYQAYFSITASYFVMLMIKSLMLHSEKPRDVFLSGLKRLAMLIVSLLLYGLITVLGMKLSGDHNPDYVMSEAGIVLRMLVAYSAFLNTLFSGYFSYIRTDASVAAHAVLILIMGGSLIRQELRYREWGGTLLLGICLFLLPLSIYSIYLIASTAIINSLSLFAFVSVYVLCMIIAENMERNGEYFGRGAAILLLFAIMIGNIYFANRFYLRQHMEYENAYAFYTTLSARITGTDGFDADSKVALIGENTNLVHDVNKDIPLHDFALPGTTLMDGGRYKDFLKYILGFEPQYASEKSCNEIKKSAEFAAMPVYPYYGSVREIDGVITVKFS